MEHVTMNKIRNVAYAALNYQTLVNDFVATVRKPNGNGINPSVSEQGNGIYTFSYTPDALGLWEERISSASNGDDVFRSILIVEYDDDDLKSMIDDVKTVADGIDVKVDGLQIDVDVIGSDLEDVKTETDKIPGIKTETDKIEGLSIDIGALAQDIADVADIVTLLKAFVTNEKYLQKVGSVWYLIIRNSLGDDDILHKALKDVNGNNVTDIAAGVLAREMGSSV